MAHDQYLERFFLDEASLDNFSQQFLDRLGEIETTAIDHETILESTTCVADQSTFHDSVDSDSTIVLTRSAEELDSRWFVDRRSNILWRSGTFRSAEQPIPSLNSLPVAQTSVSYVDSLSYSTSGPQFMTNVFNLHSKADANHIIYLDFNGHRTAGTLWNDAYNNGNAFTTAAFSTDSSASFSAAEQELILDIWRRVAEDFRPFNVDVTTAAPPTAKLIKSSNSDARWGIRVVIGGSSSQWLGGSSAGIAYEDSFNFNSDTPAFVFSEEFQINDKNIAEAITHEVGHTLGLTHDGRTTPAEEYYAGHGQGDTGWAPIMGVGYNQTLTQWSKGQYANANNAQDDLKIITTQNGFGYRDDDHSNSITDATVLTLNSNRLIGSGIIERNTDLDFFSFGIQSSSQYQLNVLPYFRGPNLDLQAVLYNEAGTQLFAFNPREELSVTRRLSLTVGKYYLRVRNVGKSGADGYSSYGSLGTYHVRVIPQSVEIISPRIQIYQHGAQSRKEEGTGGTTRFIFRLIRQGNLKIESFVDWRVTGVSDSNTVDRFDFRNDSFASGTAKFEFGSYRTFISVFVSADNYWEPHERMQVVISNAVNGTITKAKVVGTIFNDDSAGSSLVLPAGNGSNSDFSQPAALMPATFTPTTLQPAKSLPLDVPSLESYSAKEANLHMEAGLQNSDIHTFAGPVGNDSARQSLFAADSIADASLFGIS